MNVFEQENNSATQTTENILVPNSRWGDGGNYQTWDLETRSRPRFGGIIVYLRGAVPFRPNYVPSSLENVRARARHICDVPLWERRLAWAQTLLHDLHFDGDEQGYGSDDSLDGWVDE